MDATARPFTNRMDNGGHGVSFDPGPKFVKVLIDQLNGEVSTDVIDRGARLLGHVTVDNSILIATANQGNPNAGGAQSWPVDMQRVGGAALTEGQKAMAASVPVVVASDQSAVPVSAASLPLPAGASTAAKQPALGVAGTPSVDVLSVQGAASMTPLAVIQAGTDVTASATGVANTANNQTLPGVASKTTYISGFEVCVAAGTAAAAGVVTVTGTVTGTLNYRIDSATATSPASLLVSFARPIPASATNTAIAVNVPTLGANSGATTVTAHGFQL